jgi:hypothetical protein
MSDGILDMVREKLALSGEYFENVLGQMVDFLKQVKTELLGKLQKEEIRKICLFKYTYQMTLP